MSSKPNPRATAKIIAKIGTIEKISEYVKLFADTFNRFELNPRITKRTVLSESKPTRLIGEYVLWEVSCHIPTRKKSKILLNIKKQWGL